MNFSISELCYSDTATISGIKNIPTDLKVYDNLLNLIVYVLQPLRDMVKIPIRISSGYRSEQLNRRVGGTSTSQHLKGQAADFTIAGMTVKEIIELINKSGIEYDELINEYNRWVHISYNKGKNRMKCFKIG